ncbi:MAG: porin family protein [Coxiellaceae bacterium]|nr:porin family protein [Coxiellaceae bacterium]
MINKKQLFSSLLLCGMVGSAMAGGPSPHLSPMPQAWNRHTGFYLEAGAGVNAFYALLPTGNEGAIKGWGIGISAGYNFLPNVALEGGFIYSSDLNEQVEANVVGITVSASAAAKVYIPYLALRFNVPIGDRFAVIFKVGGMYPYGSVNLGGSVAGISEKGRISDDHSLPFSGVGAAYAITQHLDLNMMYQGAVYVLASGAVWSLGLTYHF